MDIPKILTSKYPEALWTLDGDDYEGLTWLSETEKPTEQILKNLWAEVRAEIQAQAQAKATARESALAKLADLGLTAEEIASL
jgi:DNA-binding NarL/FixJ family response regulator